MSDENEIPVDLIDDGVLWAINTAVFHPRGFALAASPGGKLYLQGDGSEVWTFDRSLVDGKFAAFEKLLARARHEPAPPSMPICTDPDCKIKPKPGFPMHGPHDFRAR